MRLVQLLTLTLPFAAPPTAPTAPPDGGVLTYDAASRAFVVRVPPAVQAPPGLPGPRGLTGPQGPPGVPGPRGSSGRLDVTAFPGVAAALAANAPVDGLIQAGFDATVGPVDLYLPPGVYPWGGQIYVDRPGCGVSGAGRPVTTIQPVNGKVAPFVFGLRRVETPGGTPQAVTAAHRPDSFGVLDASICAAPGNWRGFRTLGGTSQQCYGMAVDGPPVCGVIGPTGHRDFDGYGSIDGLTIQVAVGTANGLSDLGTQSHSILSLGGVGKCTWLLGTDAGGQWYVEFQTADGVRRSFRAVPNSTAAGVQRVRAWVDLAAGTFGIAQNGQPLTPTNLTGMGGFAGQKLLRNEGLYKAFIGPSHGSTAGENNAALPDYTLWAFSVQNNAVKAEPATDNARYGVDDAHTIWSLDGSRAALTRTLQLSQSNTLTGSGTRHSGYVIPCNGSDGGLADNFLRDLTIDGGGVCFAQVLDFKVTGVKAGNGYVGLTQIPFQVAYPVDLRDCNFGGYFSAINVTLCTPIRLRDVDVGSGGTTGACLFLDCDVTWDGGMGQWFHATGQEYWIKCASQSGLGGSISLANLFPSSEAGFFTNGCIVVEANNSGDGSLYVRNIKANQVGATAAMLVLSENPGSAPSQVDAAGLRWYDATGTSQSVRVSPKWAGRVDLSNNRIQRVGGTPGPGLSVLRSAPAALNPAATRGK